MPPPPLAPDGIAIIPQPNGLLTYVNTYGISTGDLSEDEVVRLRVKEVRAAVVAHTRHLISQLHTPHQRPLTDSPKCPRCGSPTRGSRRSMLGVAGACQGPFHETVS
ncbi:MAG: hypothetical protein JWN84_3597 [Nocardioides sp.]|jgi:hypothetical protein|nr:hypothetical protein [Nocardioides sp.]